MSRSLVDCSRPTWRAPAGDGETLIEPPLARMAQTVAANRELPWPVDGLLEGVSAEQLRQAARRELVELALDHTRSYRDVTCRADASSPLLLSGHQPELVHCGVWFKHFVLHEAARIVSGIGIHLSIDNDTAKRTSVLVPTGSPEQPAMATIAYDRRTTRIPYEERYVEDESEWTSFGDRVAAALNGLVSDPLIRSYWPRVIEQRDRPLGEAIAAGRHQLEAELGLETLEVPLSRVCRGESFGWFLSLLFCDFERFWEAYNRALADYREAHRLRTVQHPVPDLMRRGAWWELPLWLWSATEPVRRRCYVRRVGRRVMLSDLAGAEHEIPQPLGKASSLSVSAIDALQQRGVRVRPRALTTTLFARWMLGDLFIHGIGGAVYDQVTDQIARRWWGAPVGEIMVATGTFRLPVPRPNVTTDDLRRVEWQLRQLEFHPELFVTESESEAAAWIEQKRSWIARELPYGARRERHERIVEANRRLQPFVESIRQRLLIERTHLRQLLRHREILDNREYAFCLFPQSQPMTLLQASRTEYHP